MDTTHTINHYIDASGYSHFVQGTNIAVSSFNRADYGVSLDTTRSVGMNNIHPVLAFKYIKSRFGLLEGFTLRRRLKRLEKAFYKAVDNGQEALGEKIMRELARETRESFMYAKGIRRFVEIDDVLKVKNKIRDGHISDTKLKHYTRVIPKDVLKKKRKVEMCFDDYVIYHYYNPEVEKKVAAKQKMTPDEEAKMRDPILFGLIKETNRMYFIADWEDEFCDLTFDEICEVVGEGKISKHPVIK